MRGHSFTAYIGTPTTIIKWLFMSVTPANCDVFHIGVRFVTKLEYP
jgi:hypothetical protein